MSDSKAAIERHYSQTNLPAKITSALEAAGVNTVGVTRDDLTSFDEFHIRGRAATRELARLAGLQEGMSVIDMGCGLGGPARTLAAEFGCRVTGIDLVNTYCQTADMLTQRLGMSDQVGFIQGDITRLPFGRGSFEAAWMQHTMMNIENKMKLFEVIWRVLSKGGLLALYEVCSGSTESIHYPVPWAGGPEINFLITPGDLQQHLKESRFEVLAWKDVTAISLENFQRLAASNRMRDASGPKPPGLSLMMGESTGEKVRNLVRNLKEECIRVVQAVLKRTEI